MLLNKVVSKNLENMKKIYINNRILKYTSILFSLFVFLNLLSCNNESCDYDCVETCNLYEDFESETIGSPGNWIGRATRSLQFANKNGSQVLYVRDGSGGTIAYNSVDFPSNFNAQGCALKFDVEYVAGSSNANTTDNGIGIYSGTNPLSATARAFFTLNGTNLITSLNPAKTIEVPLELAVGTTLPSNSMGSWTVFPSSTPAADVITFNSLIQNNTGIYFSIDEGGNPAEQWWFDNFCFKQCCP